MREVAGRWTLDSNRVPGRSAATPVDAAPRLDDQGRGGGGLAYLAVSAAVLLLMLGHTLNEQWSNDYWVHLATVREMAERPWDPRQPLTGAEVDDPLLSPYALALGLVARWSGAEPVGVLSASGLVNLGLLLWGIRRFAVSATGRPRAAVWALLFTLLAWGISPWRWSGYLNLNSLGFGLPYPSTFATAVALHALSSARAWIDRGRPVDLGVVVAAVPLVLLTHPFTAVWSGIAGAATLVATRGVPWRRVLLGTGALAGGLAALAWPYSSLPALLGIAGAYDPYHPALYRSVLLRGFLALPGVVALAVRGRRDPRDVLVWTFAGTLGVFVLGGLTERWSLGRVFPGVMLAAHVALADEVAARRWLHGLGMRRNLAPVVGGTILLIGLIGCAPGLIRAVPRSALPGRLAGDPRLASILGPYRPLSSVVAMDEEVVASPALAGPVAGVGGDVLVPTWPTLLPDLPVRQRAQTRLLDPSTDPRTRWRLIERWNVSLFALTVQDADGLVSELERLGGEVTLTTDAYVVVRIPPIGTSAP